MSETLKAILSELKTRFQELYGDRLVEMILYGSQARGDAEVGSDIDVLVVLRGEVNPVTEIERTSALVSELSLRNDTLISCVFMDEDYFVKRNPPLLINVRREGISI
ncbi:MAG: nucleotidyltransferase domain-containing protein [Armatimonadetes bacterium]|nr:nucleotidyltransferase domain-containing protein [Armatimonadota bacterium]